ncbi:MAG: aldehyde dehydrogenase family protein, partial [Victivallaceae bacterium]
HHVGHAVKNHGPQPAGTVWTCPMHPEIRRDGPGSCPKCGMALEPLIGAVAAGNCVILKVSEVAGATAKVITEIIRDVFEPGQVSVINGGKVMSVELSRRKFDYIFFTGGEVAGRSVMASAAMNLTPVTLELGGKSPVVVDSDANLVVAARRIVWGKFLNAGQTCVAPDYLLVKNSVKDELVLQMRKAITEFFTSDPQNCPNYSRIINEAHFERIKNLMGDGRLLCGGECDLMYKYIAPTLIDEITLESPLMGEEIFGPVLPIFTYNKIEECVTIINNRAKPLALYYFGGHNQEFMVTRCSAGSMCINDVVLQICNRNLPFGGVGGSGMGRYHGKYTFETFSHLKSIMYRCRFLDLPLRFPPFNEFKESLIKRLFR